MSLPSDIRIGFVYIPPEGSTNAVGDTDIFDDLSASFQIRSKQGQVVICGDLNSRTGKLLDFINETYSGDIPPCTAFTTSKIPRRNVDSKVNNYGKKMIDVCKCTGLQICNGRLSESIFTCYRHNGESVVDYLLAPTNLWKIISKLRILDKIAYSDHCPISFSIMSHKVPQSEQYKNENDMIPTAYRWDNRLKREYLSRMNEGHDNEFCDDKILCQMSDTNFASNEVVATFYEYLDSKITGLFKKKRYNNTNSFPHNLLFDNECKIAKRMLHHKAKHVVSESDRKVYCNLKKNYNRITQIEEKKIPGKDRV